MKTFATVITFRAPDLLARCLTSFEGQDCEVFVQDNSDDPTRLYTRGINIGLKKGMAAGAKYLLVCCDDVVLRPGAVAALAAFLDENPECGIAMPIQLGKDGQINCGGCTQAFPYGRHVNEPLTHELYKESFESYWANGACFLLRAEAVRECGLLDENMRFICSDSDYSFTLRTRGWKIFVVPTAHVEHDARGALATENAFLEKVKDEDCLYFIDKWLSGGLFQRWSYEGNNLKAEDVANQIMVLRWRINHGYSKESGD